MAMRILIAVHHFPPTFRGGAEWRAYRTARGLQQAGYQVQVVCTESITHGDGQTLEHAETTCDGVTVHRLYFNLSQSPNSFPSSYRNPLVGQYVSDLVNEFRPDVLHLISGYLMSGSTIEAAQVAEVPVVLTLTDFWFLCPRITLVRSDGSLCSSPADPLACALCLRKQRRRYRLSDQLSGGMVGRALAILWQRNNDAFLGALRERKSYLFSLLNEVDVVISPSRFLKELFEAQGVSPHRFLYIRQGLDVSNWVEAGPTTSNSHLRIGYIGQIAKHKGVDVLVEAFRRLRAGEELPQLTLYGDVDQFPRFAKQLRKRVAGRKDVVFAGTFEHSQIRRIHAGVDVLVVPSVWCENSPNVILEAFATGTPVVVSRLGGMAELVTDGVNGFLFETGDAEDLARVLQRFVDQPDLVGSLGQGMPPVKTVREEVQELLHVYAALEVR
jgi:glycosyltransferase involved in cell wall biosynthesis